MRIIVALALVLPFFFLGCSSKDSDGGLTKNNDFDTQALNLMTIEGSYTLDAAEGLTFSINPGIADDIYVYFYSNEGNLSSNYTEIIGTTAKDSGGTFTRSITVENSETGYEVIFSVVNHNETPLNFKLIAWQGTPQVLSDGATDEPVNLTTETLYSGHVRVLYDSFYTFTKTGTGAVTINVQERDTMTDAMEDLAWDLTNDASGASISVTDRDNNISTVCQDAYADGNITCTAAGLSNGTTYRLRVKNNGKAAYAEYKVLVTE